MKFGCLINLILYAALVAGYHAWLSALLDSPEVWYLSLAAAVWTQGCLGVLYNAWLTACDLTALKDAQSGLPPRQGKWTAMAGTVEPLEPHLTAPFSGESCVLCDYEVYRYVKRRTAKGKSRTERVVDFAGITMSAWAIQSNGRRLQIFGFPDLDHMEKRVCDEAADRNAEEFVRATDFEDASGIKVFSGFGSMWQAIMTAEPAFQHHWRMIAEHECSWRRLDDGSPQVETSGKKSGKQGSYNPQLQERRIAPGDEVVAIGHYDEMRGGLASPVHKSGLRVRIMPGNLEEQVVTLAATKWMRIIGAMLALVIANGTLWGAMWLYQRHDSTQRLWQQQLETAVRDDDAPMVDKLIRRGVDVNRPLDDEGHTALMQSNNPEIAVRLLDAGAEVNVANEQGETALMLAARRDLPDKLQLLINRGASLNLVNRRYRTTALMDAVNSENPRCAELLRKAGAADDTVTAHTGRPITLRHAAWQVCREYIAAVHAADAEKLRTLGTSDSPSTYHDVDWALWSNTRPRDPQLVEGFVNETNATITLDGDTPGGLNTTWVFQLRFEDHRWRIARTRWAEEE